MIDDSISISSDAKVLDVCCGSKMMWFDPETPLAIFLDKRREDHILCDGRALNIEPDIVSDFTSLPFPDESFYLVAFDPPHLKSIGDTSWTCKKYGKLFGDWETMIADGFRECFRVLKTNGTLIFKWNESDIPVDRVIGLSPILPLFGNRNGRLSKTHWLVFLKTEEVV